MYPLTANEKQPIAQLLKSLEYSYVKGLGPYVITTAGKIIPLWLKNKIFMNSSPVNNPHDGRVKTQTLGVTALGAPLSRSGQNL